MNDILTARLIIRPLTADEAEHVVADEAGTHTDWAPDYPADGERVAASMFLKACQAVGDPYPFGNFDIRLRPGTASIYGSGSVIGGIGFHGAPDANGTVEVGFGLTESVRRNGYAREALAAIIDHARRNHAVTLIASTTPDNLASQRVLTANGMEFVGEDAALKHYRLAL